VSDNWDLLRQRYQSKSEHIMDKIRLCRDLNLPFADTRDHVLEGVLVRELAVYELGRTHKCEEDLISDMLDWQRLTDRRNAHFGRTRTHAAAAE